LEVTSHYNNKQATIFPESYALNNENCFDILNLVDLIQQIIRMEVFYFFELLANDYRHKHHKVLTPAY
jgi:hypothetical protein